MMVALFMSLFAVKVQAQNNALNFNGYSNYNSTGVQNTVTCDKTIGNFGTSDFTIEFYIKTTSQANYGEWILTKRSVCGHESYLNTYISNDYVGIGLDGDVSGTNIIDVTSSVKLITGYTPAKLVRDARLDCAYKLLKENNGIMIKEVMYEDGFVDKKHFTALSKARFGTIPSSLKATDGLDGDAYTNGSFVQMESGV